MIRMDFYLAEHKDLRMGLKSAAEYGIIYGVWLEKNESEN